MAVYRKTYRPYEGPQTGAWGRLGVIPRYALEDLRGSRFLSLFFLATFIYPVICALLIYVQHNVSALQLLNIQNASRLISINAAFFLSLLGWQSVMALFLAAFVGPGQISPDVMNNGLSLYLARPFTRLEYALGKASVLLVLMSLMTWVPGLLLFGLQGYLEGGGWAAANVRFAAGILIGSWLWILLLSALALALSAWVKWRPVAGALLFVIFFVSAAFGTAMNAVQRTNWGYLADLSYLVGSVWVRLFEGGSRTTQGAVFFRVPIGSELPLWECCAALLLVFGASVYLLARKIRGVEVAR